MSGPIQNDDFTHAIESDTTPATAGPFKHRDGQKIVEADGTDESWEIGNWTPKCMPSFIRFLNAAANRWAEKHVEAEGEYVVLAYRRDHDGTHRWHRISDDQGNDSGSKSWALKLGRSCIEYVEWKEVRIARITHIVRPGPATVEEV